MVAKAVPAKRKQTADMADSPPKRVTRARAAKGSADIVSKEPSTKVSMASTKAAPTKRKQGSTVSAAPAKAIKRKVQFAEVAVAIPEGKVQQSEVVDQPKAASTRARQKKIAKKEESPNAPVDVPKPTGRQPKATAERLEPNATKPRGRTRRAATAEPEEPPAELVVQEETESEQAPLKKATRGRGAVSIAKSSTATTSTKSSTSKKKAHVQDENDKENVPIEVSGPKKSALKPTGMRAKPMRKPAASRATTRGKKALEEASAGHGSAKTDTLPLSPKKVNQVAKTPSSSEDELSGERTIKTPAKSPAKTLTSPLRTTTSSPLKLNLSSSTAPSSPSRQVSVLGSPARRLPQSPFKDSMKVSPKKFDLCDGVARPSFSSSKALSPVKASLLQESPRKGNFSDNATQGMLPPATTPFKGSLLQSPARRPMQSPFRAVPSASDSKTIEVPVNLQASPRKVPIFSASSTVSSPLRRAKSPINAVKTHWNLDNEREIPQHDCEPSHGSPEPAQVASPPSLHTAAEQSSTLNDIEKDMEPQNAEGALQEVVNGSTSPVVSYASMALRRISVESQLSEDELASPDKKYAPTPLRKSEYNTLLNDTPMMTNDCPSLTPLATQFSTWAALSPAKQRPSRQQRGIFSLAGPSLQGEANQMEVDAIDEPSAKSTFFEDEMAIIEVNNHMFTPEPAIPSGSSDALQTSMESQASQEYGDENAIPTAAEMLRAEQEANDPTLTCTPAKVFTPAKQVTQQPREIYTVSKVPLRPSADDSPVKLPRQRSKSVGGALAVVADDTISQVTFDQPATPKLIATDLPQTPSSGMKLDAETPGRTGRKSAMSSVLKGAVVHVDVHTTEGADASGIFIDLLTQMGARCVKQWNWKPRLSLGDSLDSTTSPQAGSPSNSSSASKIGITHVVYKDGGKRTLEKVRLSDGVVMCVGVGWVLDCEREDKWLDEAHYAIDTSHIPRGGHRRRKSMEPRALANLGGNLVPLVSEAPVKNTNISPTKEFLTFNTPTSRRDTFVLDPHQVIHAEADGMSMETSETPITPLITHADDLVDADDFGGFSPTTPYYLSKGAELVQRTCPPKQKGGGLFPVTGDVEDEPDEKVRQRLLAARRKSLQWASKTRSPLGRVVSYGK